MSQKKIMRLILLNIFIAVNFSTLYIVKVAAQNHYPESIVTDELNWVSPDTLAGLEFSWIAGSETVTGLYVLRVRLAPDTRIPPHSHPDQRLSTVLSGKLYVGFGEEFDENHLTAIESGNAYISPANTPHYIWAKEGAVEYQETGVGPTATHFVKGP